MSTIERRYVTGEVAVRQAAGGKQLGGYALKFNKLSQNLGGFVERVAPGALVKTLRDGGDVLARFQHADEFLLGRTSSGTLRLAADDTGLDYEVDLPDTDYARNLLVLAERGDVRHSSFAFRVLDDDWTFTEQGFPLRTLLEIQLVDVAPVVQPAYLDTSSGLRSLAEARGLELDHVVAVARRNELAALLRGEPETPVVTSGSGDDDTEPSEPGAAHSLSLARRRHELMARRPLPL